MGGIRQSSRSHGNKEMYVFVSSRFHYALLMFANQVVSQALRRHGWPDHLDREKYVGELEQLERERAAVRLEPESPV